MRNAINVKPVLLTLPGCHHFSIRIIALPSPPCWHHTLLLQLPPATCHLLLLLLLLLLPPGNIVNDNSSQASRLVSHYSRLGSTCGILFLPLYYLLSMSPVTPSPPPFRPPHLLPAARQSARQSIKLIAIAIRRHTTQLYTKRIWQENLKLALDFIR